VLFNYISMVLALQPAGSAKSVSDFDLRYVMFVLISRGMISRAISC